MINTLFIFIFGVASGCIAFYFLSKAYWKKQLTALKKSHLAQLNQYDSDRQQRQASAQRWIEQRNQLEKKLADVKRQSSKTELRQREQLQQQYEQQVAKAKGDRAILQSEFEQYKQTAKAQLAAETEKGVNLAIEQGKLLEADKRSLQSKLENLQNQLNNSVIKNAQLQSEIEQNQQRCNSELEQAHENAGLTFATVAKMTFPSLEILQHSETEIDKHPERAAGILQILKAIDNREFGNSKKVRATNNTWFESKSKLGAVRVYFRIDKPISGKCEVLISDKRRQEKDLMYLKDRHS